MSNASGVRAGKAYIEIGTDNSALERGLKAAEQKMKALGKGLSVAGGAMAASGAAITAPLVAAAFSAAATGDEYSKMADRTGASVESLSELRHAAEQSDVSFEQLGNGLKVMQKNVANGSEAFAGIGLDVESLSQLAPDQQFEAIADKIAAIEDPAKRTAAAMSVFGKSGADLLPMLIGGSQGIAALRKEARDLGLQVSTSDAQAATLFGDTWANLQKVFADVKNEIGFAMLPVLTEITALVTPLVQSVASWVSENRGLVVSVAAVGVGLTAAGVILAGMGVAVTAAGAAIGGLASIGGVLATAFGFVVSPLGLVVGLATAAGAAFLALTDVGRKTASGLIGAFGAIIPIFKDTAGGVFDAISKGNFQLAGQIAMTGLKLAIAEGMTEVGKAFGLSLDDMIKSLSNFIDQVRKSIATMMRLAADMAHFLPGGGGEPAASAMRAVAAGMETKAFFDPQQFAVQMASSLDPEKLREEMASLRAEAAKPKDKPASAAKPAGLPGAGSMISKAVGMGTDLAIGAGMGISGLLASGVKEAAEGLSLLTDAKDGTEQAAKSKDFGTFSAMEAAMFGGDTIQKDQLAVLKRIAKNQEQGGGLLATP